MTIGKCIGVKYLHNSPLALHPMYYKDCNGNLFLKNVLE